MAGTLVIVSDQEGIEAVKREEEKRREREGAFILLGLMFLVLLSK